MDHGQLLQLRHRVAPALRGTSNSDGTRTNAGATVRNEDGSTETANGARQKAVEADGSGGGINHGTVDIASED